jgi:thiamine monophosphate kinase
VINLAQVHSKGKLSITINATGFVEKNQALLRSGAQAGDPIFVSSPLRSKEQRLVGSESG